MIECMKNSPTEINSKVWIKYTWIKKKWFDDVRQQRTWRSSRQRKGRFTELNSTLSPSAQGLCRIWSRDAYLLKKELKVAAF